MGSHSFPILRKTLPGLLILLSLTACVLQRMPAGPRGRAEVPHPIAEVFQDFYTSVPDPQFVFGNPLAPAHRRAGGEWVQYFEKAVLVADASGKVRLEPLGKKFRVPGEPYLTHIQGGPECRGFSTGYVVCYAFLEVYLKYGGERVFGQPISNIETNGLQIFQDFENARLIFRFEAPERVVVADLGEIAFQQAAALTPNAYEPKSPRQMHLQVLVDRPSVPPGEPVVITLLAVDEHLQPLEGVQIAVEIVAGDHRSLGKQVVGPTDAQGMVQFKFMTPQDYRGRMYIEAQAEYDGKIFTARRMFRVGIP